MNDGVSTTCNKGFFSHSHLRDRLPAFLTINKECDN